MTEKQIMQIAEQFFFCNVSVMEYTTRKEDILKFARAIYDKGWDDSHSATQFAISFDEHLGY